MLQTFGRSCQTTETTLFPLNSLKFSSILVGKLKEMFEITNGRMLEEGKVVAIRSPCFVHGDVLGSIGDLIILRDIVMPNFPSINSRHIFLGNYLGDKPWGLECLIYLSCLKAILPNNIILLIGNNELDMENIQQTCIQKYGDDNGLTIFEILKKTFKNLPHSAVVDGSVYCCNTNIAHSKNFNEICASSVLDEHFEVTPFGREMFSQEEISDEKVKNFLDKNNFSHLIRSNTIHRFDKKLQDRNIRISLVSNTDTNSTFQIVTLQIVNKYLRILGKRPPRTNRKKLSQAERRIN